MRPFPKLITSAAIFVFFFALAAASQWRAGAFRAEFGPPVMKFDAELVWSNPIGEHGVQGTVFRTFDVHMK